MKKLIVFSVVFALVAGVAFAQPSIGGSLKVATRVLTGSTADDADDVTSGGTFFNDAHINVNFGGADAGGMLRIFQAQANGSNKVPFLFMWWKPIEQLRLQLGRNPDGDWGHAQISGWGYNAEPQAGVAIDEWAGANNLIALAGRGSNIGMLGNISAVRAFASGFGAMGLTASITPMDELAINVAFGLPDSTDNNNDGRTYLTTTGSKGKPAKEVFGDFYANVKYDIDGVGSLRVSFNSGLGTDDQSDIFASFFVTAIDGMGIDIGLGYALLNDGDKRNPLAVGLGFRFADGDFGVKARLEAALLGDNETTTIGIGVLPYYNLSPTLTGFLNVGFGVALADETYTDWFVNPYLRVRAANGVQFLAGLKLAGYSGFNGAPKDTIDWGVPIMLHAYF